jgi:glycosyltransferase involved in cell wall biosynthesis
MAKLETSNLGSMSANKISECEVTVLLATYNRAYCLRRAIDSILDQSFQNFELIVIDDGSTDETAALVQSYYDPRVKFVRQKDNCGQGKRLNEGILGSNAPYIAIQDSDDEWLPQKLEKEVEVMREQPTSVGVVYTDRWRFEPGNIKRYWKSPHWRPEDGILFNRALDAAVSMIGPQASLIRRECFDKAGLFDEELVRNKDWEMFVRISQYYLFYHIPEPLVNYYVTSDSYSSLGESVGIESLEMIFHKHQEQYKKNKPLLAKRAYWIGSFHSRDGDIYKGRTFLGRAFRARPMNPRYALSYLLSLLGPRVYRWIYRALKSHVVPSERHL